MFIWTVITLLIYFICLGLSKRIKLPMFNSVLYPTIILSLILVFFGIGYDTYRASASVIADSLGPLVIFLAIPLYKNKHQLKKNAALIGLGITTSAVVSSSVVVVLSLVMGLEQDLILTLIPKSITTPMALSMSEILGGISGITVISVIITGITGASMMPLVIRLFGIKNPIAIGVSLGASAHGIGTSKALEYSEESGALSGLSMGLTGLLYILLASLYQIVLM